MDIAIPRPTVAAGILRDYLSEKDISISHTQALELVAKARGYESYHVLAAQEKSRGSEPKLQERPEVKVPEDAKDGAGSGEPPLRWNLSTLVFELKGNFRQFAKDNIVSGSANLFARGPGWYWARSSQASEDVRQGALDKRCRGIDYQGPFETEREATEDGRRVLACPSTQAVSYAIEHLQGSEYEKRPWVLEYALAKCSSRYTTVEGQRSLITGFEVESDRWLDSQSIAGNKGKDQVFVRTMSSTRTGSGMGIKGRLTDAGGLAIEALLYGIMRTVQDAGQGRLLEGRFAKVQSWEHNVCYIRAVRSAREQSYVDTDWSPYPSEALLFLKRELQLDNRYFDPVDYAMQWG